ncbi:MAG: hypothetical protein WBV82_18095 [Myxococcaceae bacterium]
MKALLRTTSMTLAALALVACTRAQAGEVDPASLYVVSTEQSTKTLKPGEQGRYVVSISTKGNAYVSDEAPLKLELSGKNLTVEKSKLTLKDSVAKADEEKKHRNPRFEVPVIAGAAGQGAVEGKLTFFVCTEKICSRQQRDVSVPVEVK